MRPRLQVLVTEQLRAVRQQRSRASWRVVRVRNTATIGNFATRKPMPWWRAPASLTSGRYQDIGAFDRLIARRRLQLQAYGLPGPALHTANLGAEMYRDTF